MKKAIIITIILLISLITIANSFIAKNFQKRRINNSNNITVKTNTIFDRLELNKKNSNINNIFLKTTDFKVHENMFTLNMPELKKIKIKHKKIKTIPLVDKIKDHEIKKGENLWEIAQKYNIDIDTIIGANDINNMNRIKPGDVLTILPIKGIMYKIGPGESLWDIAKKFNIKMDKIIKANNIKDSGKVKPGQLLLLPGAKPEFGYKDRLERKFIRPVTGRISSYFGGRWGKMHEGIDFAVDIGTNVRAAGPGRVVYSGWASGYGKTLIIEHQKGLRTLYAHNSRLLVSSGEYVNRGEIISKSGSTGRTTGPNMHFEVQINGKPVNPLNYLRK